MLLTVFAFVVVVSPFWRLTDALDWVLAPQERIWTTSAYASVWKRKEWPQAKRWPCRQLDRSDSKVVNFPVVQELPTFSEPQQRRYRLTSVNFQKKKNSHPVTNGRNVLLICILNLLFVDLFQFFFHIYAAQSKKRKNCGYGVTVGASGEWTADMAGWMSDDSTSFIILSFASSLQTLSVGFLPHDIRRDLWQQKIHLDGWTSKSSSPIWLGTFSTYQHKTFQFNH